MDILDFIVEYPFQSLLIFIGLYILVFFIIREILCWYWKIDDLINNQKQEITLLSYILDHQDEEIEIMREILARQMQPDEMLIDTINEAAATEEDPE